jgi:hypothetical protein
MREKKQENQRDELFDEIKPRTLSKQEWKQKEIPLSSATEPATGRKTATSDGPTAAGSGPSGSTTLSVGLTALAQEAHCLIKYQAGLTAASSSQHT